MRGRPEGLNTTALRSRTFRETRASVLLHEEGVRRTVGAALSMVCEIPWRSSGWVPFPR
jgi:hypothetical protein